MTTIEYLNSGKVLPATLPFSEAVKVGDTIYLSGQIGNIPGSMTLRDGGIAAESKQMMENIKASLEAHGCTMADLVKCTVFLRDMAEWASFNEVYETYFEKGRYPARSALGASGLALDARVEMEGIAVSPLE
jgi:2-iminobutanoate/2-iminopropanoate deaminase